MSHTPGPWRGVFVGTTAEMCIDIMGPKDEHVVCLGHDYDGYGIIADHDDARLIAAAPELLASCKELREVTAAAMRVIDANGLTSQFIAEIQTLNIADGIGLRSADAIAKAEGR